MRIIKFIGVMVIVYLTFLFSLKTYCQSNDDLFKINNGVFANHCEYHGYKINIGDKVELANIEGPGKITYFYITDDNKIQDSTKNTNCFYSGLVLQVYWDNNKYPSINVPLADFFGAINNHPINYDSKLFSINHYCYMCYISMPFSRNARFVLINDGDKNYDGLIAYGIDYELNELYAKEKSRLHCYWYRSNPTNGIHQLINTRGKGHYIGNFLYVKSNYKGWWGEGDTNFEIDGKKMVHTPGTEDEYGSCWGFGEKKFSYMNCGYIQHEEEIHQMYRWYISNPVRFRKSLSVEIQNQRFEKPKEGTETFETGQTPSNDDYISLSFYYLEGPEKVELQPYSERIAKSKSINYEK